MSDRNSIIRSFVITAILIISSACTVGAQPPAIYIRTSDSTTGGCGPDTEIELSVYLTNFHHTVASFQLWLQLDRPDLVRFDTRLDTVPDTTHWFCKDAIGADCIDSFLVVSDPLCFQCNEWSTDSVVCWDSTIVNCAEFEAWDFSYPAQIDFTHIDTIEILAVLFDTTGSLISGWEWIDSRSLSGYGTDLTVTGIADLPTPPDVPGIPPQQGGLLMTLPLELQDFPDTLTDRTAHLIVEGSFSDPAGHPIGVVPVEIVDTACWLCMAGMDPCFFWKRVHNPPPGGCDSTGIIIDTVWVPDPDSIWYQPHSITIPPFAVGDINDDGQLLNIVDLIYLVMYMFQGGAAPPCMASTDCNSDGAGPDITDLICFVTYMFQTF